MEFDDSLINWEVQVVTGIETSDIVDQFEKVLKKRQLEMDRMSETLPEMAVFELN